MCYNALVCYLLCATKRWLQVYTRTVLTSATHAGSRLYSCRTVYSVPVQTSLQLAVGSQAQMLGAGARAAPPRVPCVAVCVCVCLARPLWAHGMTDGAEDGVGGSAGRGAGLPPRPKPSVPPRHT
eukprot:SAG25_NODE_792_length_5293_cov_27.354832_2_plen_125_part_00